jgi:chaperonin cofactor prefoldin
MANLEDDSIQLWAPLIVWYGFVGLVLYLFWQEWKAYLPLRQSFLANGDIDTSPEYRYTLQVEQIPPSKRSAAKLFAYFSKLFPGSVVKANICLSIDELEKTISKIKKARDAYEQADASMHGKQNAPRPQTKVGGFLIFGGKKVDALSHFDKVMEELKIEAERQREEMVVFCERLGNQDLLTLESTAKSNRSMSPLSFFGKGKKLYDDDEIFATKWKNIASSTGFLTLNSLASKQEAIQCELTGRPMLLKAYPAPELKDVIWNNVTTSMVMQNCKRLIANTFWTLGILFWAIPVSFTQILANLDGLREKAPWLWIPEKGTPLYGFLVGYLPVIFFLILMFLVPLLIALSAEKFIKMKSLSSVDLYLFRWHFGFQIANLWLILIGGSIFNQLSSLIDSPKGAIKVIASAVPSASQFFLNILIVNTFAGLFMEISQLVPAVILIILRKIKPDSQRSQRDLDARFEPSPLVWGKVYPPLIFNLLVGLVYICIVPIIQPFCAVFFGLAYLVYKHQCLHIYGQRAEGGGAYFPLLFKFMIACLLTAEIVIAVYFGVKKGKAQAPLAFVLIIITVLFNYAMHTYYGKYSRILSIEKAQDIDTLLSEVHHSDAPREVEGNLSTKIECQEYAQPALRKTKWDIHPVNYRKDINEIEKSGLDI